MPFAICTFLLSLLISLLPSVGSPSLPVQSNRTETEADAHLVEWSEQAIWWNRTWRYRLPIDVTAPVDLYDKIVQLTVDWPAVLAQLGAGSTALDPNSLRIVEYTAGGHITRRHTGDVNRFDTLPVYLAADGKTVHFLMAGHTSAAETRRFFLYFDTVANPKPAIDHHYFAADKQMTALFGYRMGPDLENVVQPDAGFTLYTAPGGRLNLARAEPNNANAFSLYYPHYPGANGDAYGGFASAVYTSTLTPLSLDADAAFSGQTNSGQPDTTGTASFRISHLMVERNSFLSLEGSVQLVVQTPLTLSGGLILAALESGVTTGAWYRDADGEVVPYAVGEVRRLCACPGALVMKQTDHAAGIFQVEQIEHSAENAGDLKTAYDPTYQRVIVDRINWQPGDTLRYRFTYLVAPERLTYAEIQPVIESINAAPAVTLGQPIAYTDDLFHAQLRHYEAQAWNYVLDELSQHGWGEPWNIVYLVDVETQERRPAHHWDSSMGAGFILYAAALKAAMTGDPRYYGVADRYANYFLQLERTDVAQHGEAVSGRISYFYNGSNDKSWLNTPPGAVHNRTSFDQMMTSAMGLWSYYHLDHAKIQHEDETLSLLLRMGAYAGRDPALRDDLRNIGVILGNGANWFITNPDYDPEGDIYRAWFIDNTPQQLVTGVDSNSFFINGMRDRLQPAKEDAQLKNRYTGTLDNLATGSKALYPLERGQSYPAPWGYLWEEFLAGQLIKRGASKILAYDSEQEPTHYLDLYGHGGARDSIDGRGSTEDAAVAMWAALHAPEGKILVAGERRVRYIDFALDGIHAAVAFLMHDNGGMRESYPGTLGNYSAVCETCLTSDFSGYFLTLMAYYNLFYKNVNNPMPLDSWDYVQGVAEQANVTTVRYLGDGPLAQTFLFPYSDRAILAADRFESPSLTFAVDGSIAQLPARTLTLTVDLSYGQMVTGTVAQIPLWVVPTAAPVDIVVATWSDAIKQWRSAPHAVDDTVHYRVGGLDPGVRYAVEVDGEIQGEYWPDGQSEIAFALTGDGSSQQIAVMPNSTPLNRLFLPAILSGLSQGGG